MIVSVKRYNSNGDVIRIDNFVVGTIRILSEVIELSGGELPAILYIHRVSGDPMDIFIRDNNAESE